MKHRSSLGFSIVVGVIVVAVGAGWASQAWRTMSLRGELELARMEMAEWEQLRAENVRLRKKQISAAELAALREDHTALPRLRAELESLKRPRQ